jgi:hypothetical protein
MARIEYLSESEIKKFEKAPEFENDIERNYYFTLPTLIHKQTVNFINDESFIILTLMFGYFKVTNKFFELNSFSPIDTKFISDKYQLSTFDSNVTFTSRTIQRYKQLIKTHLGINEYNNDIESKLQQYAIELANNFTHRKKIFFSLIDYSKKLNIEIPSYTNLSKIIGTALTFQTKHILLLLRTYQKDKRLKILDEFVNKDENFKNRYYLSNYRKLGHSTNKREMNISLFYLKNMKSKFHILKPIIDEIGITSKISQYYARWLEQSKITQLTQKDLLNNYFLLLSFVKYQYFIRNDNIIDRFISIIQSTKSSILRHQKDLYFENEPNKKALIESLENANLSIINNINTILNDDTFNDAAKIKAMHSLIEIEKMNLKKIL